MPEESIIQLINQWAPILIFHPDEGSQCCYPSNAEIAYDKIIHNNFSKDKSPTTLNQTAPCYYNCVSYKINNIDIIRIKYWFWYNYNDFPSGPDPYGSHEGDWESVEVILFSKRLFAVLYSNHETYLTTWRNEFRMENKRLMVYVGNGSHANYPLLQTPLFHYDFWNMEFYDQIADSNDRWDTRNNLRDINTTKFRYFVGYWGNHIIHALSYEGRPPLSPMVRENEYNIPFYRIVTYTGDVDDATSDANVFINLINNNTKNSVGPFELDNYENNFQRAHVDVFASTDYPRSQIPFFPFIPTLQTGNIFPIWNNKYIDNITQIRLWHDNSGRYPGWFVDKIEIYDMVKRQRCGFNCHKWLAEDEGGIDFTFNRSGGYSRF